MGSSYRCSLPSCSMIQKLGFGHWKHVLIIVLMLCEMNARGVQMASCCPQTSSTSPVMSSRHVLQNFRCDLFLLGMPRRKRRLRFWLGHHHQCRERTSRPAGHLMAHGLTAQGEFFPGLEMQVCTEFCAS